MREPGLWPPRIIWLLLVVAAAPPSSDALATRSAPVSLVVSVLLWGGWAGGLVALLVAHPLGLTALRVLAPAAVAATVWAAVVVGWDPWSLVGVAGAVVAVLAVLAPTTVDACVDGSSYGPERRMALRVPAPLLLGPVPLAIAVVVAGVATGPLLLAARQWIVGGIALVVGLVAAAAAARALHGLDRRCIVFVPAGFVIADRAVLFESILVARSTVRAMGPAERSTDALDLTGRAAGLVIEVRLVEALPFPVRSGRSDWTSASAERFLIAPVRPGALLRHAASQRLPVR
jgi:hypothetical protein